MSKNLDTSMVGDPINVEDEAGGTNSTMSSQGGNVEGKQKSLDEVRVLRAPIRRQFKQLEALILSALEDEKPNVSRIHELMSQLVSVHKDLRARNEEMLLAMAKENLSDAEADAVYEEMRSFRLSMEEITGKVNKWGSNAQTAVAAKIADKERMGRLPELKPNTFTGDIRDWLRYWGQFENTVDKRMDISKTEKLLYLLDSLPEGTEAHNLVARFPRTGENYDEAVSVLKKRYANEDFLIQLNVTDLLECAIINAATSNKMPLQDYFVKVDSHVRALESLNLAKADPKTWLCTIVEAGLPKDIQYKWHRSEASRKGIFGHDRMKALLELMAEEVVIARQLDEKANFAHKISKTTAPASNTRGPNVKPRSMKPPSRTMGFQGFSKRACIFCKSTSHANRDCQKAKNEMTHAEKMTILRSKGVCYHCTLAHLPTPCRLREKLSCEECGQQHLRVLCQAPKPKKDGVPPQKKKKLDTNVNANNQVSAGDICLQTLRVKVCNGNREKRARMFLDTGSTRSYILKKTAKVLGLTPFMDEPTIHDLFGGYTTGVVDHKVYDLEVRGVNGSGILQVEVRDQDHICSSIKRIDELQQQLSQVLKQNNVNLTDLGAGSKEVEIMIGADLYGEVMTGRKVKLSDRLYAFETVFGWTLTGEVTPMKRNAINAVSMTIQDRITSNLWDLDLLGIRDSAEVISSEEIEQRAKREFLKNVTRNPDGRYVVRLPFKDGYPVPPSNKTVAVRRLEKTSQDLMKNNLLLTYNNLFRSWEKDNFIEVVEGPLIDDVPHHYLPHRAVIKTESLTTPVRPVFDASCKSRGNVSLNDCLHKGPSYIQLIPGRIIKFREREVGFISDIKKAFQMIEVHTDDRDMLRFAWWQTKDMKNVKVYRHKRVPFGATCSPFILGAIIEFHLKMVPDKYQVIAERLWGSLYVDNCSSSEQTIEEYQHFKKVSVQILAEAGMDLRLWLSNVEDVDNRETQVVSVLGLKWDRKRDELFLDLAGIGVPDKVTKRTVLSTFSKIFDPIGFSTPAVLPMKLLLQRAWLSKISWDMELPTNEAQEFLNWCSQLKTLQDLRIPRLTTNGVIDNEKCELHTMVDGSKHAYAAVCFLRTRKDGEVSVQLLAAKSRVAPAKTLTIPRMELLSCLIGARLANDVKQALTVRNMREFYWTDSTTALAWIRRNDQWGTFVGNRTGEINNLTSKQDWYHLPGKCNPADLPSRGCSPGELVGMKWHEGPVWLKCNHEDWPKSSDTYNETEIAAEQKVSVKKVVSNVCLDFQGSSSYKTLVRKQAWVRRFIDSCRKQNKRKGRLLKDELERAERDIIRKIQSDAFGHESGKARLKTLELVFENGVIRKELRLTNLEAEKSFKWPAVLPGEHPLVKQLIRETHEGFCHAGEGFLLVTLRRKYWILKARQSVKSVLFRCITCRRYHAKGTITPTAPLPHDRINTAEVFEVTGVDLAGPFFTKSGKKVWIVLYTCSVYRAVHLQVIGSLSTKEFIKSLRNFVEKFRRPSVIYSDNGTNFKGAYNLFRRLDWELIFKEECTREITWKFNPPTAAWWGGWWERLIRTMKDLLRKEIRRAVLSQKELLEVVKAVEKVMNDRPLTYVSENANDLEPLTPSLFLHPFGHINFPEAELVDGENLRSRYKYVKAMQRNLKIRFKKEYLAQLVSRNPKTATRPLKVGELVFVGQDNKKRAEWPLGRILELFPGKDGVARVARVKTAEGELTRPVQRLYPLEADQSDPVAKAGVYKTKSGRVVKRKADDR